jgi:hypothetical protein
VSRASAGPEMPLADAEDLPSYRRFLERQRQALAAGPPRADSSARLVRLDVELCCLEAELRGTEDKPGDQPSTAF